MILIPLLCAVFVMFCMAKMVQAGEVYTCPSCRSKNGEHKKTCQWYKYYLDDDE